MYVALSFQLCSRSHLIGPGDSWLAGPKEIVASHYFQFQPSLSYTPSPQSQQTYYKYESSRANKTTTGRSFHNLVLKNNCRIQPQVKRCLSVVDSCDRIPRWVNTTIQAVNTASICLPNHTPLLFMFRKILRETGSQIMKKMLQHFHLSNRII